MSKPLFVALVAGLFLFSSTLAPAQDGQNWHPLSWDSIFYPEYVEVDDAQAAYRGALIALDNATRYVKGKAKVWEDVRSAKSLWSGNVRRLKRIAKNAKNPRAREAARHFLSQLPARFTVGFSYKYDDGAIVADPDYRVSAYLRIMRGVNSMGGGVGAGGKD